MSIEKLGVFWPEWRVDAQIGEGSFGKVYKVVREEYGVTSHAAVKVIPIPQSEADLNSIRAQGLDEISVRTYFESIVNDFVNEIKMMLSMKGAANIVIVEDYKVLENNDKIGWDIFIRMELLTGFVDYSLKRKLPETAIVKLGQDICSALELCARRNIIHRDVKPENIFVSPFGDFKIGDFSIARELEKTSGAMSSKGTYSYMAPEIITSKKYDASVDIYSLGLVLYKLLNNNRLPFIDPYAEQLIYQDQRNAIDRRFSGEPLPPPVEASPQMAQVILKACAFDPAMRFRTATDFKVALEAVKTGGYSEYWQNETGSRVTPAINPNMPPAAQRTSAGLNITSSDITANLFNSSAVPAEHGSPGWARPSGADETVSLRRAPNAALGISAQQTGVLEKSGKNRNKMIIISSIAAIIVIVAALFIYFGSRSDYPGNTSSPSTGEMVSSSESRRETPSDDKLDDPNTGMWIGALFETSGFVFDIQEAYAKGSSIELSPIGNCTWILDDVELIGTWTGSGDILMATIGATDYTITIDGDALLFKLTDDMSIIYTKDGNAPRNRDSASSYFVYMNAFMNTFDVNSIALNTSVVASLDGGSSITSTGTLMMQNMDANMQFINDMYIDGLNVLQVCDGEYVYTISSQGFNKIRLGSEPEPKEQENQNEDFSFDAYISEFSGLLEASKIVELNSFGPVAEKYIDNIETVYVSGGKKLIITLLDEAVDELIGIILSENLSGRDVRPDIEINSITYSVTVITDLIFEINFNIDMDITAPGDLTTRRATVDFMIEPSDPGQPVSFMLPDISESE